MRDTKVSRSYAQTLFDLARRHEGLEAFTEALDTVTGLLDEHSDFRLFLETPRIDARRKKEVVRKVFENSVPRTLLNFLLITIDKRRQRLLRDIAREFRKLVDEHLGRTHIEVTLAREMDDEAVREIARRLSDLLGKEAVPHVRVRPEILGGVIVRTGDTIYDGSLRSRLERMRRWLHEAELPETGTLEAEA